jgi:hypothetical protein
MKGPREMNYFPRHCFSSEDNKNSNVWLSETMYEDFSEVRIESNSSFTVINKVTH